MAHYSSKHGVSSHPKEELYMSFCDLSKLAKMLPEDKKNLVTADYDNLSVSVQGFTISIRVTGRVPFSLIQLEDSDAPFHFGISIHFDDAADPGKTDFWVELDADLNFMMKTMMGPKIQDGLNQIVSIVTQQ